MKAEEKMSEDDKVEKPMEVIASCITCRGEILNISTFPGSYRCVNCGQRHIVKKCKC